MGCSLLPTKTANLKDTSHLVAERRTLQIDHRASFFVAGRPHFGVKLSFICCNFSHSFHRPLNVLAGTCADDFKIAKLQLVVLLATAEPEVLAYVQKVDVGECFAVVFSEEVFQPHFFNHLGRQRLSGVWLITFSRLLQKLDFGVERFVGFGEIFVADNGEC